MKENVVTKISLRLFLQTSKHSLQQCYETNEKWSPKGDRRDMPSNSLNSVVWKMYAEQWGEFYVNIRHNTTYHLVTALQAVSIAPKEPPAIWKYNRLFNSGVIPDYN